MAETIFDDENIVKDSSGQITRKILKRMKRNVITPFSLWFSLFVVRAWPFVEKNQWNEVANEAKAAFLAFCLTFVFFTIFNIHKMSDQESKE